MGVLTYKSTLNRHRSPIKVVYILNRQFGVKKIVVCGFGGANFTAASSAVKMLILSGRFIRREKLDSMRCTLQKLYPPF